MHNGRDHPVDFFAGMCINLSTLAVIFLGGLTTIKVAENIGVMRDYLSVIDTFTPAVSDVMYRTNLALFNMQISERADSDGVAHLLNPIDGEDFMNQLNQKKMLSSSSSTDSEHLPTRS